MTESLRLKFAFDGRGVRLASWDRVEMMSFPSDPIEGKEQESGFWCEVQDREGSPLYRLIMDNPLSTSIEVRTGNPEQPFERMDVLDRKGTFHLLIPSFEAAHSLVFYSSEWPGRPPSERAQEVHRVQIDNLGGPDFPTEPTEPTDPRLPGLGREER